MEQSRYQENHWLYIVGLICLSLGLIFLGVTLYLAPLVLFHWNVDIPVQYFIFIEWLHHDFELNEVSASWILWDFFLAFGLIFMVIADVISNYIDNHLLRYRKNIDPILALSKEKDLMEVKHIVLILIVAIILILAGLKIVEASITF